ncbi:MAG: hypothetical protein AABW75_02660 [Nanoarchaeota archaeon]
MPFCFSLFFEDFCSILLDHEYIHAEHAKLGIKFREGLEYNYILTSSFDSEILLDLDESIAYCNMYLSAISKGNSSKFIKNCLDILKNITGRLEKKKSFTSVAEECVVKYQIEKIKRY